MREDPRLTLIRVSLTITERWAVGRPPNAHDVVKLPVLVDPRTAGAGAVRPYLPVTGLVGSLRVHLPEERAKYWLGPEPAGHERSTGTLSSRSDDRMGRFQILGTLPVEAATDRGGSTRIDGRRGAAAGGSLRTAEWAEPALATMVGFHGGSYDEDFLTRLATWAPVLGRSRSTGMGRARVSKVESVTVDLSRPDQLQWWLVHRDAWLRSGDAPPSDVEVQTRSHDHSDLVPAFSVTFTTAERVHVGVSESGEGEGRGKPLPTLRTRRSPQKPRGVLTIPGSTWKGVYRHRCEAILRLVGASDSAREAVVAGLFGADVRTAASGRAGRGLLAFSDTTATAETEVIRRHVAIDRFTGGARDGALFALQAIPEGAELVFSVHASAEGLHPAVETLLLHVTRDLHEGLIGVGGHQTRGYGSVIADQATATRFANLAPVDVPGVLDALPVSSDAEEEDQ
ncbi:MAG: RAMP superfamily CRISPR-associated protein [Propioniciclava sp.]